MARSANVSKADALGAYGKTGSLRKAARTLGVSETSIRHHLGTLPRNRNGNPSGTREPRDQYERVEIPPMTMRLHCPRQRLAYNDRAKILKAEREGTSKQMIAAKYNVAVEFITWICNRARA